ncbi:MULTISPECIES: type 1 glutamine amidotransferase domain-containing protein [unclassified Gordonia (in: high G+C Gram-positive bacteria)]|uniref:type 1 glutamine amidotransferase domain-containing protein n=1 Tax=unclassified Gordonia (in: high G+C Gram-positive bacteria) TaxID=2657482 RepID=UPI0009ADC2B8|nr:MULTISPECIES: type 1 glutamine amidotransferase domain-containing protein [unclassified Gordonia (in: high G+C Gram-positive bacteria)]MDF3281086.1 type 1 glutamine amidotransferase domain-containing protein [Gordonia sp. N1V]OPX14974.1 type 1 glutamine amidotransferase domain-containing protein [Gordonia sp. i37]
MPSVLIAVTGVDYWTLADGTTHPCGYWPEELATPHRVFGDADIQITIATPGGVAPTDDKAGYTPEMNGGSVEAGQRIRDYIDSISDELTGASVLESVDPTDFDVLFIPGGHGPMEDLASAEWFGKLVGAFYADDRPVAAVCHGPAALLPARREDGTWLFAGRRLTGFTNVEEQQVGYADKATWLLEDRLKSEGGLFESSASAWQEHVVSDGGLFTGQNPASSGPLAELLVRTIRS